MKAFLFLLPFLVLIGVGYIFPVFKAEPYPLQPNMILYYERTGGQYNYNDRISIDKNGIVYQNGSSIASMPYNDLQDLTLFLDANAYTSLRESLYDRYKKSKKNAPGTIPENTLSVNLTVRSITGVIRTVPNAFINRILKPYISNSASI